MGGLDGHREAVLALHNRQGFLVQELRAAVFIDTESIAEQVKEVCPGGVDKLLQLLLKKGVITEEEWRKANQP